MLRRCDTNNYTTSSASSTSSSYFTFVTAGFVALPSSAATTLPVPGGGGRHTECENRIRRLEQTTTKIQRDINAIVDILGNRRRRGKSIPERRSAQFSVSTDKDQLKPRQGTQKQAHHDENEGVLVLIPSERMVSKMPKHIVLGQSMPYGSATNHTATQEVPVTGPKLGEGVADGCIHQCLPVKPPVATTKLGKTKKKANKKKTKKKPKKGKKKARKKVWLWNQ